MPATQWEPNEFLKFCNLCTPHGNMITACKDYQQLTHYAEISLEKSPVNYLWNNVY